MVFLTALIHCVSLSKERVVEELSESPTNHLAGERRRAELWARLISGPAWSFYRVTGLVLVDSQDQTESAAILKIKESMQEEAKRFEKDSDHPDYFIQ